MPSPLPILIAVLGLAVSFASAQEAADAATSATKSPETGSAAAKAAEKKTPAAASAEVKKTDVKKADPKPEEKAEAPAPTAGKVKTKRITFLKRTRAPEVEAGDRPRSFWERLFGRRRHREPEAATPTPTPTPAPKAAAKVRKVKPGATPAAEKPAVPAATPAPKTTKPKVSTTEKPVENAAGTETPVVEKPPVKPPVPKATPAPRATPAAKVSGKTGASISVAPAATPARKAPVAPSADADADAQEKYRYELAKNKAIEDPEVRKLKEKADGAATDDEARKAQRAYNKALFSKMRSIDGTIKDRADRIEAAIIKRLDTPE